MNDLIVLDFCTKSLTSKIVHLEILSNHLYLGFKLVKCGYYYSRGNLWRKIPVVDEINTYKLLGVLFGMNKRQKTYMKSSQMQSRT